MLYGSKRYPIRSTTVGTRCLTNDVYSERPSPYFFSYLCFIAKRRRVRNEKSFIVKRLSIFDEGNSEPLKKRFF